ncbi:MAG TPA: PIN domain-containing protein [Dongiaceae bacterium]|nr:PIN domain-containing protein [Dongiaceae bacterium]
MNVLVDTSVWSLALRRAARNLNADEKAVVAELAELIDEGRARIIGLVRQELLSGIKTSEQYERLRESLRAFDDAELDFVDYEAAAKCGNTCRSGGISVSLADMLMCAVAERRDWAIFATDPDFHRYARILNIKLHTCRR